MKKKVFLLIAGIVLGITVIIVAYFAMNNGGFSQKDTQLSEDETTSQEESQGQLESKEKYYEWNGYVTEEDSVLDDKSVTRATNFFQNIQEDYLTGTNCTSYYAVIPDKNYYFPEESGMPRMDYEKMYSLLSQNMNGVKEIDLRECLSLEDYYKTDTHWRQECLNLVIAQLVAHMEMEAVVQEEEDVETMVQLVDFSGREYTKELVSELYYGSYHPKSDLCSEPETFYYLFSEAIDSCQVYDYQNEKEIKMYGFDGLEEGANLYDGFLGGALSLVTIANPQVSNGKELIIFRDSFGSSAAPLLTPYYEKITLVDIRYLSSKLLGNWITFDDQDVLFLYSTTVLNNSVTFK